MFTLAIELTLIEVIVLPLVVLIFGMAVYFFIKSRKNLLNTIEASRKYMPFAKMEKEGKRGKTPELIMPLPQVVVRTEEPRKKEGSIISRKQENEAHLTHDLKQTIAQQQQVLNNYLHTIEEMESKGKDSLKKENASLQKDIIRLHDIIADKDAEIEELFQEARSAQKMAGRIDEVYKEFEQLQLKMQGLEKQASKANGLIIELEDARNAYEVIHKELSRKQEKLEEFMEENRSMREEINQLEDKLSEANLQRQQLQKKVQFLTDLNNDLQSISETNKKLQTEIRRIGELESMLTMMAEERDFLLRNKKG